MSFLSRFRSKPNPRHPAFIRNRDAFLRVAQDTPINEFEFVVFDTELTGLDLRNDEILAIGAVRIRNLQIVASDIFSSYTAPHGSAVNAQTLIHRITPQQLENAPSLAKVLPDFVDYCGQALLVGHSVGIDIGFVNRAARQLFAGQMSNPCLDTLQLAQTYTEKCWQHYYDRYAHMLYDLDSLSRRYQLPRFARHDALQDAVQTAYLFIFLIKHLQQYGLTTLKDFYHAGQSWRNIF